jgi:hypothetical protein
MQRFDDLARELMAIGFRKVLWIELTCPAHGDWRGVCGLDEQSLCCPRCQQAAEAAILARGLTRDTVAWKCVSPAVPQRLKAEESYEGTSGYVKVISRKRCDKFFARARAELAGIT